MEAMLVALRKMKPYLAIISLQFGYAGMYIISMVSLKRGMNHYILATYRHVFATIAIAPFALVLDRKIRPKMTPKIFLKIVLLAFLEPVMDQNAYYVGMKLTSATYTSAFFNIVPAVTFILAIIFRLETVNKKKLHSMAKVLGTLITVLGAMVMTMYKGPVLDFLHRHASSAHHATAAGSDDQHWVTGTLFILLSILSWASFFILQSFTLKEYPAALSLTAWICFMGALEGAIVSLVMERDMSVWVIGWDSSLVAALYSGVVCSGIAFYVQGVVNKERGPVFLASFSPLCMIITAILGLLVLSEQIHLGSIIGSIIIVLGLYLVVWGKSKEQQKLTALNDEKAGTQELPITDSSSSITFDEGNYKDGAAEMSKISAK